MDDLDQALMYVAGAVPQAKERRHSKKKPPTLGIAIAPDDIVVARDSMIGGQVCPVSIWQVSLKFFDRVKKRCPTMWFL